MTRYALALRSALPLGALALALLPLAACDTGDTNDGTIRRVLITEIAIDDAPLLRGDGGTWDSGVFGIGRNPDIYFELVNDDTGAFLIDPPVDNFSDVDGDDFPLVWSSSPGTGELPMPEVAFSQNRFNVNVAFDLYDEDPQLTKGDDDYMGSTESFNIRDLVDGNRPTFFHVESTDGDITVSIRLRYER